MTRTGFAFSIWQEADCDVIIAKLAALKGLLAHPSPAGQAPSCPRVTSSTRASGCDIPLTKELFTRLLAILTVIEGGNPDAAGIFLRAPISIPVRTPDVVRYIAGQVGIPITHSGIVFQVKVPNDCDVILSQLKALQDRLVEFGTQRDDLLPPAPSAKTETKTAPP